MAAVSEPPAKKAKTEEEPKEELEKDAPAISGPKVKGSPAFYVSDTTLNVMDSSCNTLLPLTDGGLQYLLAGARANVGLKSGRYMFEAKILETMAPMEDPNAKSRVPQPGSQLCIGFSTADTTSLFLGFEEESFGFDSEGNFLSGKSKTPAAKAFTTGEVVAVVLNLDSSSPNGNTVSLFKDGVRISPPQALPEQLKGKALYPTLTFRRVSVTYHFGPEPLMELPFKCHMVSDAAQKDAVVKAAPAAPKDGKYEVLFPVCLPDEGGFEWLDQFLKENPTYCELSDRAMLKWCEQSGIMRPKGYSMLAQSSNDKPDMGTGIGAIDDLSASRVLREAAPIQKRNFVVMEVRGNLLQEERVEALARWSSFKRVATIIVGEPPLAFKKESQEMMLKVKQETSDAEHKTKIAQEKQKWLSAKAAKKAEKEKKKQADRIKKMQEAMLKKQKYEQAKREAKAKGEPEPPAPEEEKAEEEVEEEEEPEEPEPMETDPPQVELTAEEKKAWFVKKPVSDMTSYLLNTSFKKFSVPTKAEGFDELKCVWQAEQKATQYMKSWVQEKKLNSRVEDLVGGEWFQKKFQEWNKTIQSYHAKQNAFKAAVSQKATEAALFETKKKAYEAEKAKAEKEGTEVPAMPEALKAEPPKEAPKVDLEHIDVFSVDDINDVGGGEPLYSAFQYEDWTLLSLRFELYLIAHSFQKDANDPDLVSMPVEHLSFYYQKYYRKSLNPKTFGCNTFEETLKLVRDTVVTSQSGHKGLKVLEAQIPEDLECNNVFLLLTEWERRERQRRIDMGDESAKPKMPNAPTQMLAMGAVPVGAVTPGAAPTAPVGIRPAAAVPAAVPSAAAAALMQQRPAFTPLQPMAVRPVLPFAGVRPAWPFQAAWTGW